MATLVAAAGRWEHFPRRGGQLTVALLIYLPGIIPSRVAARVDSLCRAMVARHASVVAAWLVHGRCTPLY